MKQYIKKRVTNYVKANYSLLNSNDLTNGKTYLNARCHLNAVQEAYDNDYKVLLVICIGNDSVFVHFINQDNKGKYIDNTLGWYGRELYDYYVVKEVNSIEYKRIQDLLIDTKKMLIQLNTNWFERFLKFIKEDDI